MKDKYQWTEWATDSSSAHQRKRAEEIAENVGEVAVYDQANPHEQALMLLKTLNRAGYTVTKMK